MEKQDLVNRAAELKGVGTGAAADHLDRAINRIIRALKSGRSARLPGLGVIRPISGDPGRRWVFRRETSEH